ncbi:hypothetical protein DIPPA_09067 [Diplonema papillatum]|nr:hypothetical protein DIPPA_05643 [Diplonema papillatum]KAJ9449858.1 hypothetical protein DIPPA_09067 [Diplonema papillatum]
MVPPERIMSDAALRAQGSAESGAATGGALAALGMLLGGTAATSAPMQAVIISSSNCEAATEAPSDSTEKLDVLIHPFGFSVFSSVRAGAVVGNISLSVAVGLFFYGCVHLLMRLGLHADDPQTDSIANASPKPTAWTLSSAVVRYPSVIYPFAFFLLPGTLECSLALLFYSADSAGAFLVGLVGLAACLGLPVYLFVRSGPIDGSVFPDDDRAGRLNWRDVLKGRTTVKGFLLAYALGTHAWTSTKVSTLDVERHGMLFDLHRSMPWVRGRYFLLELAVSYPVTLAVVFQAVTWSACFNRSVAVAALLLAQTLFASGCDIFLSTFTKHLVVAANLCMVAGLLLLAVAFHKEDVSGTEPEAAMAFLSAATFLSVIRAMFDLFVFWYDFACNLKKAAQSGRVKGWLDWLRYRSMVKAERGERLTRDNGGWGGFDSATQDVELASKQSSEPDIDGIHIQDLVKGDSKFRPRRSNFGMQLQLMPLVMSPVARSDDDIEISRQNSSTSDSDSRRSSGELEYTTHLSTFRSVSAKRGLGATDRLDSTVTSKANGTLELSLSPTLRQCDLSRTVSRLGETRRRVPQRMRARSALSDNKPVFLSAKAPKRMSLQERVAKSASLSATASQSVSDVALSDTVASVKYGRSQTGMSPLHDVFARTLTRGSQLASPLVDRADSSFLPDEGMRPLPDDDTEFSPFATYTKLRT